MAPNDVTSCFNKSLQGSAASLNSDIADYAIHFPSTSSNSPSSSVLTPPPPPPRIQTASSSLCSSQGDGVCMCVRARMLVLVCVEEPAFTVDPHRNSQRRKGPPLKALNGKLLGFHQFHSCGFWWRSVLWRGTACYLMKKCKPALTTKKRGNATMGFKFMKRWWAFLSQGQKRHQKATGRHAHQGASARSGPHRMNFLFSAALKPQQHASSLLKCNMCCSLITVCFTNNPPVALEQLQWPTKAVLNHFFLICKASRV